MHYDIKVAKNGVLQCTVEGERGLYSLDKTKEIYKRLTMCFTAADGYTLTVTKCNEIQENTKHW